MLKLGQADILKLLPEHITDDAQFAAAGKAANPILDKTSRAIPNLLIYARLGGQKVETFLPPLRRLTELRPGLAPLDTATLESLAWQFHVDFREVARNDAELAAMVLNSIAWHRIKGTPASIQAALELFGYRGITIDEHDPAMPWATYQLGFAEFASLEDLKIILAICKEMQPARCRLWRVYTSDYDFRPGIWSGANSKGDLYRWSHCWWSGYSGAEFPDLPGLGDKGLIVSFSLTRKFLIEPFAGDLQAAFWREERIPFCIPVFAYPVWSKSYWSEQFPQRLPFAVSSLAPFHACELLYENSLGWDEKAWQEKPWAENFTWDRRLPAWSMGIGEIAKSQGVYSDKADAPLCSLPWPDAVWPDERWERPVNNWHNKYGGWSGANSNWSIPYIEVAAKAPVWSESCWSDALPELQIIPIYEQFYERQAITTDALNPAFDGCASAFGRALLAGKGGTELPEQKSFFGFCHMANQMPKALGLNWQHESWQPKPWEADTADFWQIGPGLEYTEAFIYPCALPEKPQSFMLSLLAGKSEEINWPLQSGSLQLFASHSQPVYEKLLSTMASELVAELPKALPKNPESAVYSGRVSHISNISPWQQKKWPDEEWGIPSGYAGMPPALSGRFQICASQNLASSPEEIARIPFSSGRMEMANLLPQFTETPQTGSQEYSCAFAANAPASFEWNDRPWANAAWEQVIAYKRQQQPLGFAITSYAE